MLHLQIGRRLRDSCRNLRGKTSASQRQTPEDFTSVDAPHVSDAYTHGLQLLLEGTLLARTFSFFHCRLSSACQLRLSVRKPKPLDEIMDEIMEILQLEPIYSTWADKI